MQLGGNPRSTPYFQNMVVKHLCLVAQRRNLQLMLCNMCCKRIRVNNCHSTRDLCGFVSNETLQSVPNNWCCPVLDQDAGTKCDQS